MNILIPAAGAGRRFREAGYALPKPLIDVCGKPMISRVIQNILGSHSGKVVVAVAPGTPQMFDVQQVVIDHQTDGAARTAILAVHSSEMNLQDPLLIANSDQLVDGGIDDFILMCHGFDGGILTFEVPDRNPKWSYVQTHGQMVTRVAEKNPISDEATVGIYYWAKTEDFLRSSSEMIALDDRTNNEFYIAPSYNYLIRERKRVMAFGVDASRIHGLGTPEDLQAYIKTQQVEAT